MTKNQAVVGFLDPNPCEPKSRVHLRIFVFELHLIMQFLQFLTVIPVEPHHWLDKRLAFLCQKVVLQSRKIARMRIFLASRSCRKDNGRYLLI